MCFRRDHPGGGPGPHRLLGRGRDRVPRPQARLPRPHLGRTPDPHRDAGRPIPRAARAVFRRRPDGRACRRTRLGGGRNLRGDQQQGQPKRPSSARPRCATQAERRFAWVLLAPPEVPGRRTHGRGCRSDPSSPLERKALPTRAFQSSRRSPWPIPIREGGGHPAQGSDRFARRHRLVVFRGARSVGCLRRRSHLTLGVFRGSVRDVERLYRALQQRLPARSAHDAARTCARSPRPLRRASLSIPRSPSRISLQQRRATPTGSRTSR